MGQKYAAYDTSGAIVAYYDSIDSPPAVGVAAIEITDAEWRTCLSTRGYTVSAGVLVAPAPPTAAELLSAAQTAQKTLIDSAYSAAVQQPVSFKNAAGVTQTFQADTNSQTVLSQATQGYQIAGAVPQNFFWKAADNTLVAFTLTDLQGLYLAMLSQGWVAFQKRATLKAQIDASTTPADAMAIAWS